MAQSRPSITHAFVRMSTPAASSPRDSRQLPPAPSTSHHVVVDGLELHYLDYGTAGKPPLLCVHGSGAHAHWYDFAASGLADAFHMRALDLRGHGDSGWADPPDYSNERYAADLAGLVNALDLDRFTLIGHSMGGMVSLVYAATYPGRLAKLVIADTTMRMSGKSIENFHQLGAREGGRYATREDYVRRYRLRPAGSTAAPEAIAHLAYHATRQDKDGTWRHKIDRQLYAQRKPQDAMPYWPHIRVPVRLVKGGSSPRITPEIFAEIRACCPQAELVEVPGADHHVMLDNPAGFVAAVKDFIATA